MKRKTFKSIACPEIPKNLSKVIAKKEINTVYAKIVKGFDNIISTGIMISSRLGKMKLKYGGTIPWYRPVTGLVDWGLNKIDSGHSINAIEEDGGNDAILDRKEM